MAGKEEYARQLPVYQAGSPANHGSDEILTARTLDNVVVTRRDTTQLYSAERAQSLSAQEKEEIITQVLEKG